MLHMGHCVRSDWMNQKHKLTDSISKYITLSGIAMGHEEIMGHIFSPLNLTRFNTALQENQRQYTKCYMWDYTMGLY